jgi:hypothetical protein
LKEGDNVGREVKRVPLDFDYPLKKVWYGYQITFCHEEYEEGCERCREFARIMGIPMIEYACAPGEPCPEWKKYFKVDPPEGEGWQLWETTTEGSPVSPVFKTPEELAEWCEENATVFADIKATKKEWLEVIQGGLIAARCGPALFV